MRLSSLATPLMRAGSIGLLVLSGCDGRPIEADPTPGPLPIEADPTPGALSIALIGGDHQVAPARAVLPVALEVRVTDSRSRPVPGIRVTWNVQGGGFVQMATTPSVTDANGLARVYRILGATAGLHSTTASLEPYVDRLVTFTSVAQIQGATRIDAVPGTQVDTVLATLPPHRVAVRDHNDAPVANVRVQWTAVGGGSVSGTSSVTDASGIAEISHTLGPRPGEQRVVAAVPGLAGSPVAFPVDVTTGIPVELRAVAGDSQMVVVNDSTPYRTMQPYVVQVRDAYGNAVENVVIDWTVTGGSITPVTGITWSHTPYAGAVAPAIHTVGPRDGTYITTATATALPEVPPVTFMTSAYSALVNIAYDAATSRNLFFPGSVFVRAGSSVRWEWGACNDFDYWYCSWAEHNITFEDDPSHPVSSSTAFQGAHVRTFSEPGTVRYRCTIHSTSFTDGMVGTVTVEKAAP